VFWLATVRDACSNRIVGWKTSDGCGTGLVLGAVEYGIWSRDVRDGRLIQHRERGSTYTFCGPAAWPSRLPSRRAVSREAST
jgi:hypothetical protein